MFSDVTNGLRSWSTEFFRILGLECLSPNNGVNSRLPICGGRDTGVAILARGCAHGISSSESEPSEKFGHVSETRGAPVRWCWRGTTSVISLAADIWPVTGSEGARVLVLGVTPTELTERALWPCIPGSVVPSPPLSPATSLDKAEDGAASGFSTEDKEIGESEGARKFEETTRDRCLFSQSGVGLKSSKRR